MSTVAPAGIGPNVCVDGGAARTISSAWPEVLAAVPFSFLGAVVFTPASLTAEAVRFDNAVVPGAKLFFCAMYAVTA